MKLDCGHESNPSEIATGYGTAPDGKKICYACCAEADREQMRNTGKATLYLTIHQEVRGRIGQILGRGLVTLGVAELSNWPGSLKIPCCVHTGKHNIARTRYDVSFTFEGTKWYGTRYGENTQLCHCTRYKNQKGI